MNNMMSVLFASGSESKLNELTLHRTTASLPFGGRYRLIDFTLSNLVNSGITRIGIVTSSKYQSLMDHIRQGRDWDLNRKNAGLSIFPPFAYNSSGNVFKGKVEAMYSIADFFLKEGKEKYVVIANCNVAVNIDYEDVLEEHIRSGAKITVVTHDGRTATSRRIVTETDSSGRVVDICETEMASGEKKEISLNSYVIEKELMMDLVRKAYAHGQVDFERDILFKLVAEGAVNAYKARSYAAIVDDVKTYYEESMNLLNAENRLGLFGADPVYTKVKDSVPTLYRDGAKAINSLLADGCVIEGRVANSILFRNVRVGKGAVVEDSIVMENGRVSDGASLKYAITDKDVTIGAGKKISGALTYPMVISKGKTV